MIGQSIAILFGSFFVLLFAGVPISVGIGIASIITGCFFIPADIFSIIAAAAACSLFFSVIMVPAVTFLSVVMMAAGMTFSMMIVVVAVRACIHEFSAKICLNSCICIPLRACAKLNTLLSEGCLGSAANTAADQHIDRMACQKAGQCSVAGSV